ncbi:MAG: hypothetical protein A3C93_01100 [Candidatus Lloydbacteria bacterium RIFCSPHIGHO2_02_FULL_54_17]|uniref:Uncharacterized protein n=1 Tax=Candidatus Lloydbacteria bacterium RIFCSPHIGHO2_02_FULL_54_17 TaxID=1798664 RepID=A0A1G2DD12_9BACT|nr:MAG: hypothetical protein A3C93_01100 [Candidatus Lloydbacteria bacterium RIFCSPHIGHO2_02_FULL_54_17]OGZ16811.1 MAG: hypothetical protein A3H76_02135 [Candidatus Lloydbacteria bacterium RIFCSPLOWO2_02_FULL_54_12]
MKSEGQPVPEEGEECVEQLFVREIKKALSPTWAKTTQELLPGYLPDRPTPELSKEELALYRTAFQIVGKMVEDDEVEVLFGEGDAVTRRSPSISDETLARPRFKLKTHGGKRSRNVSGAWQGSAVSDAGL